MHDACIVHMVLFRSSILVAAGICAGSACTSSNAAAPSAQPDSGAIDAGDASTEACPSSTVPGPGMVVTERGPVHGVQKKDGSWSYLGIPYAAPPVGALRWAAPQARDCWTEPLEATKFAAVCVQRAQSFSGSTGKEDCLTINVFAPPGATPTSALPVLVFFHGGGAAGYAAGSAADQYPPGRYLYDGADFAAKANAVVVTLDFRIGAMGFLAHPSFGAHTGNYGVLDQIFGLKWVKTNIVAFGGDRSRVLVFGQSMGADAVCNVVASPLAKGLMSAALMESGGCSSVLTAATAAAFAQTFAQKAGCDTAADPAACMRALDASTVNTEFPEPSGADPWHYLPYVDGYVLPDVPSKVIASGAHNHVPFVVGSNSEETGPDYFDQFPKGMTEEQYEALALAAAGNDRALADQVLALYPASAYGGDPRAAAIAATTDYSFGCKARFIARAFAKGQSEPVWRYYFTHHVHGVDAPKGAWHGLEYFFLLQYLTFPQPAGQYYVPTPGEQALADSLDGYWSRLASGDPNGGGAVAWPRYDATSDAYLQIDETSQAGAGLRTKECDFWDTLAKY